MTLRQIAGGLLALVALIFFIQTARGASVYISRGGPVIETLLSPEYALRLVASLLGLVGGALAIAGRKGGAWFGLAGALMLIALTGLVMASTNDTMMRNQIAFYAVPMLIFALVTAFTKRA